MEATMGYQQESSTFSKCYLKIEGLLVNPVHKSSHNDLNSYWSRWSFSKILSEMTEFLKSKV